MHFRLLRYLKLFHPSRLKGTWIHRYFGNAIFDPNLWIPIPSKVALGLSVGAFISMIPLPIQTFLALIVSFYLKIHIPSAVLGVWITNPLTIPFFIYLQYRIGSYLLGINLSWPSFSTRSMWEIWRYLIKEIPAVIFCGSMITGIAAAIIAYPIGYVIGCLLSSLVKKRAFKK